MTGGISCGVLLDRLARLAGREPDELSTEDVDRYGAALLHALNTAWWFRPWSALQVSKHAIPAPVWPHPAYKGITVWHPDSNAYYQLITDDWDGGEPAEIVDGVWLPRLPQWALGEPMYAQVPKWSRNTNYTAGSRVEYGGSQWVSTSWAVAGAVPGGASDESAVWVKVPQFKPHVARLQGADYPPVGRLLKVYREGGEDDGMEYMFRKRGQHGEHELPAIDDLVIDDEPFRVVYIADLPRHAERWDAALAYDPPGVWHRPNLTRVATPTILPDDVVVFDTDLTITITCATELAEIRYTLDGSTPSENSPLYVGPFQINTSAIVKARAWRFGMTASKVAERIYTKGALIYWGASSSPVLSEAEIQALPNQEAALRPKKTYSFAASSGQYLYMAWPDDFVQQPAAGNGFVVDGLPAIGDFAGASEGYSAMHRGWPYMIVSVNGRDYRVYRSKYSITQAVSIVVNDS